MPDVILPYEGGKVVLSEEAQKAMKAAVDWSNANSDLTNAFQKGSRNKLDAASTKALRQFEQEMRANPPKPATIINLHPWPLSFGAVNRFTRGITVPACEPGMPYAFHHVRGYRRDWCYNEDGSLKFGAVLPIQIAAEFVREFCQKDSYQCGVIIYEGDTNPEKMLDKDVEMYDPAGRAITKPQQGVEYDAEDHPYAATIQVPVTRKLRDIVNEQRDRRNLVYLDRVRKADHDYNLPGGKGVWLLTPVHTMMADVLYAEHQIAEKPKWNMATRVELSLAEKACPGCGADPRAGAFKCANCGHILNAFAAYAAGAVEWGHVSMETMSSDEWEEAHEIKAKREKNRTMAEKNLEKKAKKTQ
jgi:hypothetical protein